MHDKKISENELNQIKKDVLREVFPAQCDLIGDDLKLMINEPFKLKEASIGSLLNFYDAYQTIANAIDFLNNCLNIFITTNGIIKKEPPSPKIIEELFTKTTITKINKEEKEIIVKEIERHVKRYG